MIGHTNKRRSLCVTLLVNMLAALIVVSLVQAFLVKVYRVPSGSMEQTLQSTEGGGDRILVNRTAYLGESPSPGDVVVFTRPDSWAAETPGGSSGGDLRAAARIFGDVTGLGISNEEYLVKRVVAAGGDTVACCSTNGSLVVNGVSVKEPHIYGDLPYLNGTQDCDTEPRSLRCFPEHTVPAGHLLVLGDHRSQSSDSVSLCRAQGTAAPPVQECIRFVPAPSIVGRVILKVWPLKRIGTLS